MKYVSIRRRDPTPFGETLREASVLAIVAASRPIAGSFAGPQLPAPHIEDQARSPSSAVCGGLAA